MLPDLIPAAGAPPERPEPSRVRALIPDRPASRRALLRGVVVAAVAATLVPFDWFLSRTRAGAATGTPGSEWTASDCRDGYPDGYQEVTANWHRGPAVCYGGWRIGAYPCNDDKWHFEGERADPDTAESYSAHRVDSYCGRRDTRSAWRWTHGDGQYRCSDAITTVRWDDGTSYTGLTIAMCRL